MAVMVGFVGIHWRRRSDFIYRHLCRFFLFSACSDLCAGLPFAFLSLILLPNKDLAIWPQMQYTIHPFLSGISRLWLLGMRSEKNMKKLNLPLHFCPPPPGGSLLNSWACLQHKRSWKGMVKYIIHSDRAYINTIYLQTTRKIKRIISKKKSKTVGET